MNSLLFKTIAVSFLVAAETLLAADAPPSTPAPRAANAGRVISLDELFTALDKNHDGKISKEEATGIYAQRFAQWDADGDGFATRQEIHDYRLRIGIDDNGNRIAGAAGAVGVPRSATKIATVLKDPADWRLETMSVPPSFAPEVKLSGAEEIRFAPGMFDNTSDTYFTCALVILADGAPTLGVAEIKDFLERYYRGLSTSRAQRSKVTVDPAQMNAVVAPAAGTTDRFDAHVDFFDSFSDGRKITLNVEAQVIPQAATKRTCLLLLVSPSAKETPVWPSLREIGKKASANAMP